jgi:DNA-binding beta-propeller fold protein YncE
MGRVVALALLALLVALLIALITALVGVSSRHGTATGPVLATLTLGPVVAGVALDTRAGRAVVGSDFAGRAYVVDTRAGTLLRTIAVAPATTVNRPMVSPGTAIVMDEQDGRAFVGSPSYGPPPHGLSIIDTGSGLLLATIPYRSIVGPWFAADPRSHRLFTLDGPGRVEQVRVYDTRDGHLVRVVPLDMPPSLSSGMSWGGDTVPVAVDTRNGRVFVGRQTSNGVSTVDEARGRLLRTTTIAPLLAAANSINVTSPIVDEHDDRVFVASGDGGTVSTLDARSGRVLRSVRVGQYASNPVIDSVTRRVFVAAGGGLVVLDARSGRLLSRSSQPAGWGQSPVVDGRSGNVLIIDELRRTVGVYDGARGRLLRSWHAGGRPRGVAVDGPAGRVYVLDNSGGFDPIRRTYTGAALLRVFDERTGRPVRAIALGPGFADRVYIDARTRRAVVLVNGGSVQQPDPWGWLPPWARRVAPFAPRPPAARIAPSTLTVIDTSRL